MNEMKKYQTVNIPLIFLENYDLLNLSDHHFILMLKLMYLNEELININLLIEKNILSRNDIGELISNNIISIKSIDEEMYIDMLDFYNKISSLFKEENNILDSLFLDKIQYIINRKLQTFEIQQLNMWLNDGFIKSDIENAIQISLAKNIDNFNYIEKILYDKKNN